MRSFLVCGESSIPGLRDVFLEFWIRWQMSRGRLGMRQWSVKIYSCVDVDSMMSRSCGARWFLRVLFAVGSFERFLLKICKKQ